MIKIKFKDQNENCLKYKDKNIIFTYFLSFLFLSNQTYPNINTKNNNQNKNINYFLLGQWHINDIMVLTNCTQ